MSARIRRLVARAAAEGLDPAPEAAERLVRFARALIGRGARLSLVSRSDLSLRALADKHFADARNGLVFAAPARDARVLDYGAGAGVVGVTWSLLRKDLSVTLLESRHKKARFLQETVRELSLDRIEVRESRGEDAPAEAAYDLVVSRGVATDRKSLASIVRLVAPGGAALFFKGPESALAASSLLGADDNFGEIDERSIALPEDKRRVLLLARRSGNGR